MSGIKDRGLSGGTALKALKPFQIHKMLISNTLNYAYDGAKLMQQVKNTKCSQLDHTPDRQVCIHSLFASSPALPLLGPHIPPSQLCKDHQLLQHRQVVHHEH